MKIILKIEVSDETRRAIRFRHSRSTAKATREECRIVMTALLNADLEMVLDDYVRDPERRRRAARKLNNLSADLRIPRLMQS